MLWYCSRCWCQCIGVRIGEASKPRPWAGLEDPDGRFDDALFGHLTGEDGCHHQLEDLLERYGDRSPALPSDAEPSECAEKLANGEQLDGVKDGLKPLDIFAEDWAAGVRESDEPAESGQDDAWPEGPVEANAEDSAAPRCPPSREIQQLGVKKRHVGPKRQRTPPPLSDNLGSFHATKEFAGHRAGYVFSMCEGKTGYYKECNERWF